MTARTSVLVVVLIAVAAVAGAQDLEFGAKAGPAFATLAFEPDDGVDHDHRISADGGGFFVFPLSRAVGVQLEAMFTSRGAKLFDEAEQITGAILLQYLDFPVMLRVKGPSWGSQSLHVFGGAYPGFRLSAKREVSLVANSIKTGNREEINDEIEPFQFGVLAGAALDVGRFIVIDGRYSQALTALNKDKSDGVRIRSSALSFMIGVRF